MNETLKIPQVYVVKLSPRLQSEEPIKIDDSSPLVLKTAGPFEQVVIAVDDQEKKVRATLVNSFGANTFSEITVEDRILKPGWTEGRERNGGIAVSFLYNHPNSSLIKEQAMAYWREYQQEIPFAAILKLKQYHYDFLVLLENGLTTKEGITTIDHLKAVYTNEVGEHAASLTLFHN